MRVIITGVPRAGKTTLSGTYVDHVLGLDPVRHTDDLRYLKWSRQSEVVASWFRDPGPWVIEGTTAVRAVRKWLRAEPTAPCDQVIWMPRVKDTLTPRQHGMAEGIITIWNEVEPKLLGLGVQIERK